MLSKCKNATKNAFSWFGELSFAKFSLGHSLWHPLIAFPQLYHQVYSEMCKISSIYLWSRNTRDCRSDDNWKWTFQRNGTEVHWKSNLCIFALLPYCCPCCPWALLLPLLPCCCPCCCRCIFIDLPKVLSRFQIFHLPKILKWPFLKDGSFDFSQKKILVVFVVWRIKISKYFHTIFALILFYYFSFFLNVR